MSAVLSRVEQERAARALRENPLWPALCEAVRGEIAREWLTAKTLEERERLAAQAEGVVRVVELLNKLARAAGKHERVRT